MKQHMIDLLPDSIRSRSEAGMVIGRYITVGVLVVIALVALSTHAHFQSGRAERALEAAEAKSRQVLAVEAEAKRLHDKQNALATSIEQYDKVAPTLPMLDLQRLIVGVLPESVCLERMDIEVITETPTFDPRIDQKDVKRPPMRVVRAEINGIAVSDAELSELVNNLEDIKPLSSVAIDFSKSRTVRQVPAREFRISFRIDLDRRFDIQRVNETSAESKVASGEVNDVE
jgi:hypothetical protein